MAMPCFVLIKLVLAFVLIITMMPLANDDVWVSMDSGA
jgi:hypothetical protein